MLQKIVFPSQYVNFTFIQGVCFPPFRHLRFWQESFWHGYFITGTFWQVHGPALFLPGDISAPEHFEHGRFGTDISAPVLLCRNVPLPKCPCAEMFLCQKFLTPKIPRAEKSSC